MRRVVLIVAAVIAASLVFGAPFFGDGVGLSFPLFPLLVIGLIGLAVYAARDQRRQAPDRNQPPPPWGSTSAPPTTPEGSTMSATDTRTDPVTSRASPTRRAPAAGLDAPADTGLRPTAAAAAPHRAGAVLADPRTDRHRPGLARHLRHREPGHRLGVRRTGGHRHRGDAADRRLPRPARRPDRPGTRLVARPARHQHRRCRDRRHGRQPRAPRPAEQPCCARRQLPHLDRLDPGRPGPDARPLRARRPRPRRESQRRGHHRPRPRGPQRQRRRRHPLRREISVGDLTRGGFDQSVNSTLSTSSKAGTPTLDLDLDARVGSISVEELP